MAESRPRRSRTARRALAIGCVAAAGTGIGLGVSQATASAPGYRTAVASTASVTRTLSLTGVLEPVDQATTAFQVAGTVATVAVAQGQQVAAGQTIASLDPTLLQQQVSAAQAALTAAQAKLAADESGQSTNPAGGTGSAGGSSGAAASTAAALMPSSGAGAAGVELASVTTGSGQPRAGSGTGAPVSLSSDQQAVVDAQHRADVDLQAAGTALTAAESTCSTQGSTTAPTTGAPPSTTTATTAPSTTTTAPSTTTTAPSSTTTAPSGTRFHRGGSAPTTTTTSPSPAPGGPTGGTAPGSTSTACASALAQAQSAQQKVAADQQTLARAEATLAQLLASQAGAAPGAARPSGTGTGTRSSGSQTPSRTPGTGAAAAQATPTPAQLASDQATIDTDDAALAQAEQSLSAAVLTSPISGTVASVGITPGETVSSRSSSATITIVNSGSYQTTVSLDTTQVQSVKVGDSVSLTIDGQPGTFHGTVGSVGPVDTSNSSFTYPATIAITSPTGRLPAGSTTRTTIDVAGATDALVVPTSAVHTDSPTLSFVYLDNNGKEARHRVTVGVVGPIYTQIRSGLARGQAVVLADPSQPVPASNTSATAGGFGGAFRAGGGGSGGGAALRNLLRGSGG